MSYLSEHAINNLVIAGEKAYNDGLLTSSNPFEKGTNEHYYWNVGWHTSKAYEKYAKLVRDEMQDQEDKYWLEGIQAYEDGKDFDTNPYEIGSIAYEYWDKGWCDASDYLMSDFSNFDDSEDSCV